MTFLAVVLVTLALVGAALGVLVLRADPRRWDNRFFAGAVFVDSINALVRTGFLVSGRSLTDVACMRACTAGAILVCYVCAEFAYAFPRNRPAPATVRAPMLAAALAALFLLFHPTTFQWFRQWGNLVFFWPLFAVTLTRLYRNWRALRSSDSAGIPLVLAGIAFRWSCGLCAYTLGKSFGPQVMAIAIELDATVVVFIGYVFFGYSVLKYNLFRVRGVIADLVIQGGFAIATGGLVAGAVDASLTSLPSGALQRTALIAIAMVPALFLIAARWLKPRVEEALREIDPGRGLAKTVAERVARGAEREIEPGALLSITVDALIELTGGGRVRFLRGPAYPRSPEEAALPDALKLGPELGRHLLSEDTLHLHRPHQIDLPRGVAAELAEDPAHHIVGVRRGSDLYGALAIDGGQLDREGLSAARTLGEHLALKLENSGLFTQMLSLRGELEETRRLASLGAFAAAIAHDIRTPLTSVQMNVQILRGKVSLPPDDMEYFDIALDELKRLNASIQEILDYAKPVQLERAAVELSGIADEAARRMGPLLAQRQVSLERCLDDALPRVRADASRIRQVVINLLDNAAQASATGSAIVVSTRSADGDRVALEVKDTGRGIRAEDLPKIFEPFFTTRADGTGLGLAIAQKLVRAHGGEIRVDSTPGVGSTFTVLLPAA